MEQKLTQDQLLRVQALELATKLYIPLIQTNHFITGPDLVPHSKQFLLQIAEYYYDFLKNKKTE